MPIPASVAVQLSLEQRQSKMDSMYQHLMILPPPGLSAIKESDLGNKVSNIVPEPFKCAYPKTSQATTSQVKQRKKEKSQKIIFSKKRKIMIIEEYNDELILN